MPFKTEYGTLYHMTEGCCNATIPCGTEGLSPCSICCGGKGTDGDGGAQGPAVGAGSPMSAGDGEYSANGDKAPVTDESVDMLGVVAKACDEGDTIELPNGYTLVFREAWETGFPEDGYVLEEPMHGIPIRQATATDMEEAARQLKSGVAGLGSGSDWHDYVQTDQSRLDARRNALAGAVSSGSSVAEAGLHGMGSLPVPSDPGSFDLSMLASMGGGIAPTPAPAPPMPRNMGNGFYIDVDGTIIRDGNPGDGDGGTKDATRKRASELIRRFDNSAPMRFPSSDYASQARESLVSRIEGAIDDMPEDRREEFRRTAQATWNTMHPEAPVLEWSRDDEGYISDSKTSVVKRWRNYDEMRDFNHGSNAVGYDYGVFDKATGDDVTDELHHRDVVMRRTDRQVSEIEEDIRVRAQREVIAQRDGLYQEWLNEKRQQSNLFKYHGGSMSWDRGIRDELWQEFVSDTGYSAPDPVLRPTSDEREELARLYAKQREARKALDDLIIRHGVDDETLRLIRPQYQQRL